MDAHVQMQRVTLDIICDVGFSFMMESKSGGEKGKEACTAVNELLHEMSLRGKDLNPLSRLEPRRWLAGRRALQYVNSEIVSHVETQKLAREGEEAQQKDMCDMSLLDHLLQASSDETDPAQRMNSVEFRDEVATFLGAGHETTANMMSWTLYELAKPSNATVLKQLQDEIDEVLAGVAPTTPADLAPCTYLEMVLQESLRLHPIVAVVNRTLHPSAEVNMLILLLKCSQFLLKCLHFVLKCLHFVLQMFDFVSPRERQSADIGSKAARSLSSTSEH